MIRNVLVVDDDKEMLRAVRSGLEKYEATFQILTALDGVAALDVIKARNISLVVTDLKMPRMDGFTLLAHIIENYPDIPVIIITAYSTPEMEQLARQGGAIAYIAKPFMIENLARKIITVLRRESEGGTLHNVSSGMFLQLIEMEQKTCTIRLVDKKSGKKGVLFFKEGELLDARIKDRQGNEAAYEIFGWDEVNLSIQNYCATQENHIQSELQPLILEAMRRKDESAERKRENTKSQNAATPSPPQKDSQPSDREATSEDILSSIRQRIEAELGSKSGISDIYFDESWNNWVGSVTAFGEQLGIGKLKIAYVDRNEENDLLVLPGKETILLEVESKSPRDRLLQILDI